MGMDPIVLRFESSKLRIDKEVSFLIYTSIDNGTNNALESNGFAEILTEKDKEKILGALEECLWFFYYEGVRREILEFMSFIESLKTPFTIRLIR